MHLQGFRIDGHSALIRTSSRFYTWDYGIKVYEQTYTCTVTETIQPPTRPARATLKLTAQVPFLGERSFTGEYDGQFE